MLCEGNPNISDNLTRNFETSERDPFFDYVLTKLAHSSKATVTFIVNFTGKVLLTLRRCQVALNNPNEN